MKDSDILNARLQKLQQDFEAQLIACDGLNQENQGKAMELKVVQHTIYKEVIKCDGKTKLPSNVNLCILWFQQKEDEVTQMKGETARLNKMRETIQRKLRNVEDQKADVEQQKETLKSQIIGLERGN